MRAATGDIRTGMIGRESEFPLADDGLRGALRAASSEYTSPARFIVPEEYLYLTQVEVPATEASRSQLVKLVDTVFPETLSELAWDFEVIAEADGRATIDVSGVTKDFGGLLKEALASSRVRLEAVIPESYALARALPTDDAVLFVHERRGLTIVSIARMRRVVSAIVLDHRPSEAELRDFIEFGKTHKQCTPEKLILSGIEIRPEEFSSLGLDALPLALPLDPVHGALLLDLSSRRDADRLDLPLRGYREPWYRRLFHFF
ncbi:MAG: hypothetical protein IPJ68_06070 [Candidatus Moraniibacteriota bacterium]|nr:MAG: hypothetical protein IPJ68_06070 [Candidatus Moranbacteria bacterium]